MANFSSKNLPLLHKAFIMKSQSVSLYTALSFLFTEAKVPKSILSVPYHLLNVSYSTTDGSVVDTATVTDIRFLDPDIQSTIENRHGIGAQYYVLGNTRCADFRVSLRECHSLSVLDSKTPNSLP